MALFPFLPTEVKESERKTQLFKGREGGSKFKQNVDETL
jgi:hypothetical protein